MSHFFRISNIDINIVADSGFELFKFGARDVNPPGVT
jgi:hypothetical protein